MNSQGESDPNSHCSIVGPAGILVQIGLGVLSFSVLILKRHFEDPKRAWKIWRFDTAKQVISQMLAHFINLTISVALTEEDPSSDTCLWYFITNVFDNTVGVCFCVFTLRLLEHFLIRGKKYHLISGNYYEIKEQKHEEIVNETNNHQSHPEHQQKLELSQASIMVRIHHKSWINQLLIWNSIVIISKFVLFGLEFLFQDFLDFASKFLLGWIQVYPNLELLVVIVVVPVFMNGLAFWVQDNFLKKRVLGQGAEEQGSANIQIIMQDETRKKHEDVHMEEHLQRKQSQQSSTEPSKQIKSND